MSALPYLIMAVVSIWAVVATAMAMIMGKDMDRVRQGHEASQDKIARYRLALSQLKHKADEQASRFELLEREHTSLKQSMESQDQTAGVRPAPVVIVDTLDISAEVAILFEHVARVAVAVRNYSAYSRGHHASESSNARYDLLWLADCLHSFDQVGKALARDSSASLSEACEELATMYDKYLKDSSGYNSRDTFQRLASAVPLVEVTQAIKSMTTKVAAHQDQASAKARDLEIDRFIASVAS